MIYSKIIGTGSYLPEKVLTNHDLEKLVDTSNEWIIDRTGIEKRHIAADHETASSMGKAAAQKALEAANINSNELDLIIVGTCTPEKIFPSTACLLQHHLGIEKDLMAFDLTAACAGFLYALSTADQFIRNGLAQYALVVGTEVLSRLIDWSDRTTCVLFGDGAGAVVLKASETPGIHSSHMHAQGKFQDILYVPNKMAGVKNEKESPYIHMQGKEVFKVAVDSLGQVATETLEYNQLTGAAIDWLVPHQANIRIITNTAKKLKLPMEKVILTIAEHGNTSAASIPLALDIAVRDGRIKPGHKVLLEAIGGGMAWGSVFLTY